MSEFKSTLTPAEVLQESVSNGSSKKLNWSWLWYAISLPMVLLTAALLSWGEIHVSAKALPMVMMTGLLCAGLLLHRYHSVEYRSYRSIGVSYFYASAGFLFIFAILAITRLYYSRTFLLSSYLLIGLWMLAGVILLPKTRHAYLIITGGIASKLKDLEIPGWSFWERLPQSENLSDYDGVVVDMHVHADQPDLLKSLSYAGLHGTPIINAASVLEQYRGQTDLDYVAEEGLYEMSSRFIYPVLKRVFEVLLILLAAPLVMIIAAVTALAIKMTSPGPVLFTQRRVGRFGREYTLYKFRSMTAEADDQLAKFTLKDDDRLTPVGRFIRKFRIDELPQFWNVLKGEMNLIGPRPEQKYFVEYFDEEIPFYSYRHKVRPGITGWAQIKDGYAADLDATKTKLQYDLYYIKNLSFSLDLLIVYATVKTILTGFGSR
jgi:lipopolysaccharide/colanic/teichoic acid biosynthesis glycosyltransferase